MVELISFLNMYIYSETKLLCYISPLLKIYIYFYYIMGANGGLISGDKPIGLGLGLPYFL